MRLRNGKCVGVVLLALTYSACSERRGTRAGADNGNDTGNAETRDEADEARSARARELIEAIFAFPYPEYRLLGDFLPTPSSDWDKAKAMIEEVSGLAGRGEVEMLLDNIQENYDRQDAIDYGSCGSRKGSRAALILSQTEDKILLASSLARRTTRSIDPYLKHELLSLGRTSLPRTLALGLLGHALDDEREGWPEAWQMKGIQGTEFNYKNRVCDFAYKRMRQLLDKQFRADREDELETEVYNRHLNKFRVWWNKNGKRIVAGEKVPLPEFD